MLRACSRNKAPAHGMKTRSAEGEIYHFARCRHFLARSRPGRREAGGSEAGQLSQPWSGTRGCQGPAGRAAGSAAHGAGAAGMPVGTGTRSRALSQPPRCRRGMLPGPRSSPGRRCGRHFSEEKHSRGHFPRPSPPCEHLQPLGSAGRGGHGRLPARRFPPRCAAGKQKPPRSSTGAPAPSYQTGPAAGGGRRRGAAIGAARAVPPCREEEEEAGGGPARGGRSSRCAPGGRVAAVAVAAEGRDPGAGQGQGLGRRGREVRPEV